MIKRKLVPTAVTIIIITLLAIAPAAAQVGDGVILGGNAFGVRLVGGAVTVAGLDDVETKDAKVCPAGDAGIVQGDEIVAVDGDAVGNAALFAERIEKSDGKVVLTVRRGEKTFDIAVTPARSAADGKMRLGLLVKDSTAGIGTMTFIVPDTLAFGALGHGIGGADDGETRGAIYEVTVNDVTRGQSGSPGELGGTFGAEKIGTVTVNCEEGVFGVCSAIPDGLGGEVVSLCPASDVKEGAAKLYCTLGDDGVCGYDVKITDVAAEAEDGRSFVITVTDRRLIERTGGIVQGMSGSPLVQDGKLIGAVTHVLISDPTRGYGIFIGNMLEKLPEALR